MARMIDGDVVTERLRSLLESPHGENVYNSGYDDAIWHVLDVIEHMPTLTPPNEPLTIEQLREMDGEPVYAPETNCWVLITKNQFVPLFTWPDGEQCSAHDWYEQVGPVYRRPPERQEDT